MRGFTFSTAGDSAGGRRATTSPRLRRREASRGVEQRRRRDEGQRKAAGQAKTTVSLAAYTAIIFSSKLALPDSDTEMPQPPNTLESKAEQKLQQERDLLVEQKRLAQLEEQREHENTVDVHLKMQAAQHAHWLPAPPKGVPTVKSGRKQTKVKARTTAATQSQLPRQHGAGPNYVTKYLHQHRNDHEDAAALTHNGRVTVLEMALAAEGSRALPSIL